MCVSLFVCVCVAISPLGGAVSWWLHCVPVTARGDVNLVRISTLHLSKVTCQQGGKQLIYVEITSSDLKDRKLCVVVSLAPYQGSCETLLAVDEGI